MAAKRRSRVELSENARIVLERRYLAKDESGRVVETPEQLFRRVTHSIAQAVERYESVVARSEATKQSRSAYWEERFYDLITSLRFLPNSPTLGNAGRPL